MRPLLRRLLGGEKHEPLRLPKLARAIASRGEAMLTARTGASPRIIVDFDAGSAFAYDCRLRRESDAIYLTFSAHSPDKVRDAAQFHALGFLYWFATAPHRVRQMTANCSDGDRASSARFSPSTFLPGVVPFPDSFFLASDGYALHRREGSEPVAWDMRSELILWRGSMNGPDSFVPAVAKARPDLGAQRLLLALAAQGVAGVDVRFINAGLTELSRAEFERLGLAGEYVPPLSWAARKFAIDVDGWTNAWPNYFCRMLDGCCVFKVQSKFGYRQWFYDRLQPWVHYIPVAPDCRDFAERVAWARSHDGECREIARRARDVMLRQTFEAVSREAWDLLMLHA